MSGSRLAMIEAEIEALKDERTCLTRKLFDVQTDIETIDNEIDNLEYELDKELGNGIDD